MVRPSRFSPRSEPHEALEARTVCREVLCDTMVRGIGDAVRSGQARFDLVVGPRGAGKSHLMGLIEGRLRKDLEGHAIFVGLPEDFHPSSLVHLLAEILKALPPDPDVGPVERQLAILAGHPPEDARGRAVNMIRARLRDLSLVIVIENLDVVFMAIGRDGQHQLRSILQTERRWSIVATSRSRAPAFSKESEPFFGTFVVRVLEPLSAEGCREMLVRLARATGDEALAAELSTPKGLARVQTLRHVLGGYPRAMAFILPHLHHDRPDMVENALHELAEELTPYFQEQMNRLSPGQRPVAELLAEHWNPLSVSEIALATFASPTTISTHLRYLRGDAIVRCTKLGREHFYEISDPLFRIARAMKRDDLRAKTFLRVLQGWYDFRGMEFWDLPEAPRAALNLLPDMMNEYSDKLVAPLMRKLQEGRYRQLLDDIPTPHVEHPVIVALRIIALSYTGADEEAFAELASLPHSRLVPVISSVWATEATLANLVEANDFLAHLDRGSFVGRFAAAGAAFAAKCTGREQGSWSAIVEALEPPLRASAASIRGAASEIVLQLAVPLGLARKGEYDLCGRVLALLVPVGSKALKANLAVAALSAWARGRLSEVFHQRKDGAYALSRGFGALPKLGLLLIDRGRGETMSATAADDARAAFEASFLSDGIHRGELDPADQTWLLVTGLLLMQDPELWAEELRLAELLLARPVEMRMVLASALHAGALQWIAAGRDLTPIIPSMAFEKRLAASLGAESPIVVSPDPDVTYVRLAAPERATVRQFAKVFGLDERHAELAALSTEEDTP